MGRRLGMTRLPALEPRERVVLLARPADLDERLRALAARAGRRPTGALPARRGPPHRPPRLLGVVRRPGRIAEPVGFLLAGELEQCGERARMLVDRGVAVPELRDACGHRPQGEILRLARRELVPRDWRRDARVRSGPDRVRARDRAILGVLVVVDEHAVTLLLPPPARRDAWRAALDLARQGEGCAADVHEGPAALETDVDVHATRPGRLRPCDQCAL